MRSPRTISAVGALAVVLAACGSAETDDADLTADTPVVTSSDTTPADTTPADTSSAAAQAFPDIVDATATETDGAWSFQVTVSSPYDSPDRYADGWRILGPDGTEYGFRLLTHDHASEQPFTRSLSGVVIPDEVDVVTIEGRDQVSGFGGGTFELALPGR